MYYKIVKSIPDDSELDTTAGIRAIRRFETLHPHNISQKTAIMLEHFHNVTAHKINGRAKAMIVTPSRLHAVRYLLEFKRQIQDKGYNDLDVLVAFSGEVYDDGETYTEERMKAVQTLSWLNRTMRGKLDTFVLDFVNTPDDIKAAFEPYYEETVLEQETDPKRVIGAYLNTINEGSE